MYANVRMFENKLIRFHIPNTKHKYTPTDIGQTQMLYTTYYIQLKTIYWIADPYRISSAPQAILCCERRKKVNIVQSNTFVGRFTFTSLVLLITLIRKRQNPDWKLNNMYGYTIYILYTYIVYLSYVIIIIGWSKPAGFFSFFFFNKLFNLSIITSYSTINSQDMKWSIDDCSNGRKKSQRKD